MKVAIALACLLALCAAAENSKQVEQIADLDVAENHGFRPRHAGGHGRQGGSHGGYSGGHGSYHKGGIRRGRSVEDSQPNVMEVLPVDQDVFDMDVAEDRRYGGHHAGHGGRRNAEGYSGGYRGIYGGQVWGRNRRSTEDDVTVDLEAAAHHSEGYGSNGGYENYGGYGNSGGYGNNDGGYSNYPSNVGYPSNNYGSQGEHNNWGR